MNADAVTAAADALWEHIWPGGHTGEPYSREEDDRATLTEDARVAVAAAEPIIREQVARDIEASKNSRAYFYADEIGEAQYEADTRARDESAQITRGGGTT